MKKLFSYPRDCNLTGKIERDLAVNAQPVFSEQFPPMTTITITDPASVSGQLTVYSIDGSIRKSGNNGFFIIRQ